MGAAPGTLMGEAGGQGSGQGWAHIGLMIRACLMRDRADERAGAHMGSGMGS